MTHISIRVLILMTVVSATLLSSTGGTTQAHHTVAVSSASIALAPFGTIPPVNVPSAIVNANPMNLNPVSVLEEASQAVPGFESGLSPALNFLIVLTVLALAPSILVMCTCFTRFVIVLALVRQAIGAQSLPPSQVITGIALLLTLVVMAPTIQRIHEEAIAPYQEGDPNVVSQMDVWNRARMPLRDFMFDQIEAADNWEGVYLILEYRGYDISEPDRLRYEDVDMLTLIPAFIISELKVAFLIGIRVYLPFLIIDMVVASLLISMGMLMLPPVLISLPFKLLLFVLVDGWHLLIGNLLTSVVQREPGGGNAALMHSTSGDNALITLTPVLSAWFA